MPSNRHLGRSRFQVMCRVARAAWAEVYKEEESISTAMSAVSMALDDLRIPPEDPLRREAVKVAMRFPRPGALAAEDRLYSNLNEAACKEQFGG